MRAHSGALQAFFFCACALVFVLLLELKEETHALLCAFSTHARVAERVKHYPDLYNICFDFFHIVPIDGLGGTANRK